MNGDKIYTHDEAARTLEMFEDILSEHGISVPSPEDDERDEDDMIGLYGSTYSNLLDEVEEHIIYLLSKHESGAEVVEYEFSGTF